MKSDNQIERRDVLKKGTAGIVSILGSSSIVTARPSTERGRDNGRRRGPPSHSNAPDWVKAKNGELTVTASESEWNERQDSGDVSAQANGMGETC